MIFEDAQTGKQKGQRVCHKNEKKHPCKIVYCQQSALFFLNG